tara:strand:+ start:1777 stop:2067 length:291 start_codon:yes stop_codon:yes gene_type:complete
MKILERILRKKELRVGDLVNHILYGREWIAVVLKISESPDTLTNKHRAMVRMVPGTRYERFFKKYTDVVKVSEHQGWVSCNWLIKVEEVLGDGDVE